MYYFLKPCENSTYLQDAGAESWAESFSDIPQSVLSKLNLTAKKSCYNGSETESCRTSQFGMMSEPSMEKHGEEKLTSLLVDFHAKTSVLEPIPVAAEKELKGQEAVYGKKWLALSLKCNPQSYSLKTVHCLLQEDLPASSVTLPEWGLMQDGELFMPLNSDSTIFVEGCSFMPTPTATNVTERENPFVKGTMWRSKSGWVEKMSLSGKRGSINWSQWMLAYNLVPTPTAAEYFMGWIMGWTDLKPLAMDKYQQWLNSRGIL
jgi:hypothetical protein